MRPLVISVVFLLITCSLPATTQENEAVIFLPYSETISQIEWSPDGTKLAVNVWPEIHIFDTNSWERIATISGATSDMSWHPDSQLIAGAQGGPSERVFIWDTHTGELVRELNRSRRLDTPGSIAAQPTAIAWHPSGNIIATDATIRFDEILFWDVSEENKLTDPIVVKTSSEIWHNSSNLEWSHDGEKLLTTGSDDAPLGLEYMTVSTSYVLHKDSGETLLTFSKNFVLNWGPNDTNLIGISFIDGSAQVTIWDATKGEVLSHYDKHTATILDIEWNSYSSVVASADLDDNLLIWDADTGISYEVENPELTMLRDITWKPHSNTLAIASAEGVRIQGYTFEE